MKRTDDGRWCHIVCAMWIPGPGFGNPATREPIEGIEYVSMGTGICQGDAPKGGGGRTRGLKVALPLRVRNPKTLKP